VTACAKEEVSGASETPIKASVAAALLITFRREYLVVISSPQGLSN
jgi:hypothetical protein